MVLTLELPLRSLDRAAPPPIDVLQAYSRRFGAAPAWFDEISAGCARSLALRALRQGVPLATADCLT